MMHNSSYMEFAFEGKERETLIDPRLQKIDANGKVYLSKKMAGQIVLVIPVKPEPGDKERFMKVGRG